MSSRDRLLGILLLLVVFTAAVFWQVRNHDFVTLDDKILVYGNKYYQPGTESRLSEVWKKPHEQLFMPLTYSIWAVLAEMARVVPVSDPQFKPASKVAPGFDPNIFHSFNLLLHVLSVLLVFAILRLLLRHDWAAAVGALFFGLHPMQVESVAWIAELKGVQSGFFGLLAIWLYLCSAKADMAQSSARVPDDGKEETRTQSHSSAVIASSEDSPQEAAGASSQATLLYVLATLSFLAALLSKPSAVTYPAVAALLDYFFLRRCAKAALKSVALWFALALAIVWKAREAQPVVEQFAPLWARPLIALDAIAFYIGKILLPVGLAPEYTRIPQLVLEQSWAYWTWLLPAGVGVLLWKLRRYRALIVSYAIFIAVLLPVLGLVPFIYQYYSTVADRYLYVAMMGPALAVAWALSRRPQPQFFAVAGFMVVLLAGLSFRQSTVWSDDEALYQHTLKTNSRAWFARNNLAALRRSEGKMKEAEVMYREAIQLRPDLMESNVSLGALLLEQGRTAEAVGFLVKAAELSSPLPETYINLGEAYLRLRKYEEAAAAYKRAAFLEPENAAFPFQLFEISLRLRNEAEAKQYLQAAQKLSINPESYHATTAAIYAGLGRLQDAVTQYLAAIEIRPDNPDHHNNLGATLLRAGYAQMAKSAFENALKLNPAYVEAHSNYGVVLTQQKKYREAEKAFRQAIKLNPKHVQAYAGLVDVLTRQKKTREAREVLQQASKNAPSYRPAKDVLKNLNTSPQL